jgi:hypothetical protein
MSVCPWCHRQYDAPGAGPGAGGCPFCGAVPPQNDTPSYTDTAAAEESAGRTAAGRRARRGPRDLLDLFLGPEGAGLPWENRGRWGTVRALALTLRAVLFSPLRAFRAMRRGGGWREPLVYALLVGTTSWVLVGSRMLLVDWLAGRLARTPELPAEAAEAGSTAISAALVIGLAPLAALALPALAALGAHAVLRLCHIARPLRLTYRIACYAAGSAPALAVLPVCGNVLALAWYLIVASAALFLVHRIGVFHAVGAALLPPLAAAGLAGALFGGAAGGPPP